MQIFKDVLPLYSIGGICTKFFTEKRVIFEKEGEKDGFFAKKTMKPLKMPPEGMRKGYNRSNKEIDPTKAGTCQKAGERSSHDGT